MHPSHRPSEAGGAGVWSSWGAGAASQGRGSPDQAQGVSGEDSLLRHTQAVQQSLPIELLQPAGTEPELPNTGGQAVLCPRVTGPPHRATWGGQCMQTELLHWQGIATKPATRGMRD